MYWELTVLSEYPIHIEFEDEMAVDQGGATRDVFCFLVCVIPHCLIARHCLFQCFVHKQIHPCYLWWEV